MSCKSSEEIARAIAHLEYAAPLIPQRSGFGDDNRARIDMEIRVLRSFGKFMDFEDFAEEHDLDIDEDYELFHAADEAWKWCEGEEDTDDDPLPAQWDTFLKQKWEAK